MRSKEVQSGELEPVHVAMSGAEALPGEMRPALLESEQRAQRLARRFELLSQTASELLGGEDTQTMIDRLCRRVMEHLDCHVFINFLLDQQNGQLLLNACAGFGPAELRKLERLDSAAAICGEVARGGQCIIVESADVSDDPRIEFIRSQGVRAYACHPLLAGGRVIGTLSFGARTRSRFSEEDLSVMKAVSAQVAMAMERIGLLEEARRKSAELEKANRVKDQFLAMLSHEMRTPLTPVLLAASMLEQRDDLPSDVRADLAMIRRNVLLEARIIGDLLDLTHLGRGRVECEFHAVDMHAIVRAAAEVCGQGEGAVIELDLRASPSMTRGDAGRLTQVLWNLLCNARRHTPRDGRITVRTTTRGLDEAGARGLLHVEVADTGDGIEPQKLERLFSPFEQTGRPSGGLGLGLSIARAIARAHGGSLEARSAGRGRGATFTLRLPLGMERDAVSSTTSGPAVSGDAPGNGPRGTHRPLLRILLVEDHDVTLRVLTKLLTGLAHQVHPASSVAAAIRAAQSGQFDIVISDLGLPDGNGHDLMRYLRDRHGLSGIALTGFGTEIDVRCSRECGFIEHITKPVDLHRLELAIQQAGQQLSGASTGVHC